MVAASSYRESAPTPALAGLASSVWIQRVGDVALAQRHVPHGGAELRCVLGAEPRLIGPLTSATHQWIPASGTVVGIRLRPGVVGSLVGMPADELTDEVVDGGELWSGLSRLVDGLGDAATPRAALEALESWVAGSCGPRDRLVGEAVRRLMPWHHGGPAALPELLAISERQLRRRCRDAVGMAPKELQRVLRFQGFLARVQASVDAPEAVGTDLARWATDAGYHDQSHLSRECRRLMGAPPGEVLAQYGSACACGHDHAASYRPMLGPRDGRFVQEGRPIAS